MGDANENPRFEPTPEQKDYLKKYPLSYSVAIVLGVPGKIVENATASLIEIESRLLAVTNFHVLQAYEKLQAEHDGVLFQVGNTLIDPHEKCWDAEENTDLLVLDVTGPSIDRLSRETDIPGVAFLKPKVWPAPDAAEGDSVVFAGFPEVYRADDGRGSLTLYTWGVANVPVTEAYEDRFYCKLDRTDWRAEVGADDPRVREKELSGMSGSPVFRVYFGNSMELVLDLLGFIMGDQLPHQDKLLMTSASNMLSNGQLKHRPKR